MENIHGAVVVDKPAGWTSHDVVNKVRRLSGIRKVGHLGTLDPGATGVLPLLIGRATRLAQFFVRVDKWYEGVIRFGYSTDTYDAAGLPTSPERDVAPGIAELEEHAARFRGRITQIPPPVSAKKVGGVPAYKLARQKKPVELEPVTVEVYSLQLYDCAGAECSIRIHCSSGTYVRSLAHDLGQALGCGAFLKQLRRTASGPFTLEQARTLEGLAELAAAGRFAEAVIPGAALLPDIPSETVDATTASFIRQGRDFRVSPFRISRDARLVKAVTAGGELIAIGEAKLPNLYHPILVL